MQYKVVDSLRAELPTASHSHEGEVSDRSSLKRPNQTPIFERVFVPLQQHNPSGSGRAFAFAVACVVVASAVRGLAEEFGVTLLFASFYPAVFLATLVGGAATGTFTAVMSIAVVWFLFFPAEGGINAPNLLFFLLNAVLIVWVCDSFRELVQRVLAHEKERQMLLNESQHRSKNLLQVAQTVVSRSLSDRQDLAEKICGRLRSISTADELLLNSKSQYVDVRELLEAELRVYGGKRIGFVGPVLSVSSPVARSLALICHELATNAAKYGCLSNGGSLLITWVETGSRLRLRWEESGVSNFTPSHTKGFGLQMIDALVLAHHGHITSSYKADGMVLELII